MSTYAYWLFPDGIINRPTQRHILAVVHNTTKFGETENSVKDTFDKFTEQIFSNIEGKAREEILLRVIRRGHIRIRINGTRRSQHWSIQVHKLTAKVEDKLWFWANQVINNGTARDKFADVVIHELGSNDKMTRTSLNKIAQGGSIKECVTPHGNKVLFDSHIYSDDELHLLEDWIDYAHIIEPEQLHENAKVQILAHKLTELEGGGAI